MPSDDMATDPIPSESMQDHDASRPPSSAENPESDLDDDKRYLIHVAPARKRYISERKKLDSAAFQDWVATNDVKVQRTKAIGTEPSKSVVAESAATEHWKDKIIASPREYQLELFERAKMKNTIIVLDTGSGKTLISALLLRHTLDQELECRDKGAKPRIAIFLVEKVALCFQQHAVLQANIEHPIARFFGEVNTAMKTKAFWDKQLKENMAFVCTSQIVLDLLNDGLVSMTQVNLLVFDEAHHTKKNHPYARIIKDHYLRVQNVTERPRILGMTASPVDAKTRDLRAAAMELESLMCSEIATVSYETLVKGQLGKQQRESVEYYEKLQPPHECRTELGEMIRERLGRYDSQFKINFDCSRDACSVLGLWCADRHWKLALHEKEVERLIHATSLGFGLSEADPATEAVRAASAVVEDYQLPGLEARTKPFLLSPKTHLLTAILQDAFEKENTQRCIVFVEKRHTAFLLSDLFQQPEMKIDGMVPSYMVGSQNTPGSIVNMTFYDQFRTLGKFRAGELNCLFSTTVAEEGIDIPECDLIIRFDLYNSVIQYIQSKGRARKSNSRYIQMIQRDDLHEKRKLKEAMNDSLALRRFCEALPVDRKLDDDQGDEVDAISAARYTARGQRTYDIASTGASLTFPHSLEVLARFVGSLGSRGVSLTPEYIVSVVGGGFSADIIFPESSPVKIVSGFTQRTKHGAKCSAAYEACVQLIKKGLINSHLQPTFAKRLPAMRNARIAISSAKRAEYGMRIRPEIWSRVSKERPTKLYATKIWLDNPQACPEPTTPLVLFTRERVPQIPPVPLFFGRGGERATVARLTPLSEHLDVTAEQLELLSVFTLKIFADVFSKDFEVRPEELPYYLGPLSAECSHSETLWSLDWPLTQLVKDNEFLPWENQGGEARYVVDQNDGSRKFILRGINPGLKPSDPTPEGVPAPRRRAYEGDIKGWSCSLWVKTRKAMQDQWKEDQPVFDADLQSLRRELLYEPPDGAASGPTRCYIVLEPLQVSPLPVEVASMAYTLPSILHRADSYMIALDACAAFDLTIRPDLALEAMTKDRENIGEDVEQQTVNFQHGMGNNYERLEFLGDTFLKMATTISVFTLLPSTDEFEYHVERMLMLCNQNLFNHAVDRGLQEYIRSKSFDRRTWYPDLKLRKGKAGKPAVAHSLAQKSIADVCEALIGAAYVGGLQDHGSMDMAVKAVTKMVKSSKHRMTCFQDYYAAFTVPGWQTQPSTAAQRQGVDIVESAIHYRFRSPTLLRSAFKHPSYPYETTIPHYERLEFLGDALLDMAIVDYLYRTFPSKDEGWMTEHKSAMVSNQFLGALCVKLGLARHALFSTASMTGERAQFTSDLDAAERAAREDAEGTGSPMRQDYWTPLDPPKALADVLEAVVGAMFVDAGYDYRVVQAFFTRHVQPFFADMDLYETFGRNHPITVLAKRLGEEFGCRMWSLPFAEVPCAAEEGARAVTGVDYCYGLMVHGRVVVHKTSESMRYGKPALARKALKLLEDWTVEEFRGGMRCDCRVSAGDEGVA